MSEEQSSTRLKPERTISSVQATLNVKILAETAGAVALAGALNLVKVIFLPQGGSITLASMVPVLLLSLRRGWKAGIPAGVVLGLVVLVEEGLVVHPAQLLLDYPLAFGAIGAAGFFRTKPLIGVVIAITCRFISHFVSGVIFFASFAPAGQDAYTYSVLYNGSYLLPELVISVVVIQLLMRRNVLKLYL